MTLSSWKGPRTVKRMFPIRNLYFGLNINIKEAGGARCWCVWAHFLYDLSMLTGFIYRTMQTDVFALLVWGFSVEFEFHFFTDQEPPSGLTTQFSMRKMSFSVMWNLHNHTTSSDCSFSFVRPCLPSAQLQAELSCESRLLTGFGTTTDQMNQKNLPKKQKMCFSTVASRSSWKWIVRLRLGPCPAACH